MCVSVTPTSHPLIVLHHLPSHHRYSLPIHSLLSPHTISTPSTFPEHHTLHLTVSSPLPSSHLYISLPLPSPHMLLSPHYVCTYVTPYNLASPTSNHIQCCLALLLKMVCHLLQSCDMALLSILLCGKP